MKPILCLAVTTALCLTATAQAAIPAPADRLTVADAGQRSRALPEPRPQVRATDESAAKARKEATPAKGAAHPAEVDFTLHWYN